MEISLSKTLEFCNINKNMNKNYFPNRKIILKRKHHETMEVKEVLHTLVRA